MTNYTISIISDTVCPWCYVGKKNLDRAIALHKSRHPTDTFTTTWHPYYLNPNPPIPSIPKRPFYVTKFGAQRAEAIFERLESVGRDVGIAFNFNGRTGSTRDSHRLIQLAGTKGPEVQARVVEELFEAYFEKEEDISAPNVLQTRGLKAGLAEEEVRTWLESGGGGKEVDAEVEKARRRGISGVPHFTVQGEFEIAGAEAQESIVRVFEKVKVREQRGV